MNSRILAIAGVMFLISLNVSAKGTSPFIINIKATGITPTSATISWTTVQPADSQVAYGLTTTYLNLTTLDPLLVVSHARTLTGLISNTLYHYQVRSTTSSGALHVAGDFVFSTPPNIVPGMIRGVGVSAITGSSAMITWTTNTPADSQVQFGTTVNYGSWSWLDPTPVTVHTVLLTQLSPNALYHFRAQSDDANGNRGISDDFTFTTTSEESPLVISALSAFFITSDSATIRWSTSIPANSQVDYGITPSHGSSTNMDPTMLISHLVTLDSLSPNTLYHYRVRSTDSEGEQVSSADLTFTTPAYCVFFPQLSPSANAYSAIALANLDRSPAMLSLAAFDGTGAEIQGNNLKNPLTMTLNAGTQLPVIVDQLFGQGISSTSPGGWTAVDSSTSQLKGFFLIFDDPLSLMDGAPLSRSLLDFFVLPEAGAQDFTRLLLANPSNDVAAVTIDLMKSDGSVLSEMQTNIPAFGSYSADLETEIFPGVTIEPSDYIQVSSSAGLVPYEFFGNISKDIAVLAGQDLTGGGTTLYSPHYVDGGPYDSTLSIVNLDGTPGTVTLALIAGDGTRIGTSMVPIAANGKIYISGLFSLIGVSSDQTVEGYVKVTSSGIRLSGSVVFSDAAHGSFTTALPLLSTLGKSHVLAHVASNSTFFTGLAILNPNSSDANVQISVYTAAGQLDTSVTQVIPAGHRAAQLLTEYFPSLAGQDRTSGYIKVTADQEVGCYGVFGTRNLSVLSTIPAEPAP